MRWQQQFVTSEKTALKLTHLPLTLILLNEKY